MEIKQISLVESSGFELDISLAITNGIYLEDNCSVFTLRDNIQCTIYGNEENPDTPICKSSKLKFVFGKFNSENELDNEKERLILNLKYILAKMGIRYQNFMVKKKDLSKLEINMSLSSKNVPTILIKQFEYDEYISSVDLKLCRSLSLLEMANSVNGTVLELILYVFSIEALVENHNRRNNKEKIIELLKKYRLDNNKEIFETAWKIRNDFTHKGINLICSGDRVSELRTLAFDIINRYSEEQYKCNQL